MSDPADNAASATVITDTGAMQAQAEMVTVRTGLPWWQLLARDPLALCSALWLVLLLGCMLVGPELLGKAATDINLRARNLPPEAHARDDIWPLRQAIAVLVATGVAAGFVSEWFVDALEPAIEAAGISQAFAGLVVVAIAGNAVEHAVGIQLAWRGKAELAVSVVLNSALQVAVALVPIIVLVSFFLGGPPFTLAIPPILAASVFLAVLVVTIVTVDGEADMVDGAALVGLYVIIAAIFWWG